MKVLLKSVKTSLEQIIAIVDALHTLPKTRLDNLYTEQNIGKHIRHISDHFYAVKHGIISDMINYNERNRGTNIETDSISAVNQLNELIGWLDGINNQYNDESIHQEVMIYSEVDCLQTLSMKFKSSLARELLYLINHTIHHAAHIGLICQRNGIEIPLNTGMAPCTMTYLRAVNQ
jgi:uncharacterized damage-inducible protein DinB